MSSTLLCWPMAPVLWAVGASGRTARFVDGLIPVSPRRLDTYLPGIGGTKVRTRKD